MISFTEAKIILLTYALYTLRRFLQPLFLGYLIYSLMEAEPLKNILLYCCVVAMGTTDLIGVVMRNQFGYSCDVIGFRMSSALKSLIYHKIMQLSKTELLKFSIGHIIDLVSNDVQRLEGQTVLLFFFAILDLFVVVPVTAVLLVYFIGWQALLGATCLCILVPYFMGLSYIKAKLHCSTAAITDRRISLVNQVISGIRAIKTHAWEDAYQEKIKRTRSEEIKWIGRKSVFLSSVAALEYTSVPLAMLTSVITLVLTGHPLTPFNVFMLLSLVNVARFCFCYYVPYGFLNAYEASACLKRIEDFLFLKDLSSILRGGNFKAGENVPDRHEKTAEVHGVIVEEKNHSIRKAVLEVSILTSKEKMHETGFLLKDVQFSVAPQALTVITGPVGSGKSFLLRAIAGEESVTAGAVTWPSSLAYVPQTSWVYYGTVRQNILFGQPYDEPKYLTVVEACCLVEDFHAFPNGDQTVVGERGAVLSGGQRARVSLARAVYMDADLYLLDDPLSAVDKKVGQHIFAKCIKGILSYKTRLLASHQKEHFHEANEIIVLCKGRMLENGTFAELQKKGIVSTTLDSTVKNSFKGSTSDSRSVTENEDYSDEDRVVPIKNQVKELEISDEDRDIGGVTIKVYWDYFRSGLHPCAIFGITCFCLFTQVMIVLPDVWLSFLTKKTQEEQKDDANFIIFGCLVLISFIFAAIRAVILLWASIRCSKRLHDKMVEAILRAPVVFFDSNPVGRVLNRFSKDIACVDELLPKSYLFSIQMIL